MVKMRQKNSTASILLLLMIFSMVLECAYNKSITGQETKTQTTKDITPKEAFTMIQNNKNNPNFVILDVRTPKEFADGHIENAVNLDYYSKTFREQLNKLDKDKTYLVHCRSGNRSQKTLEIMKEFKYKEVYNMLGGIAQWKSEGLPITK